MLAQLLQNGAPAVLITATTLWLGVATYVAKPALMLAVYPLIDESFRFPSNFHSSSAVPDGHPPAVVGVRLPSPMVAPVQIRKNPMP